MTLYSVIIPTYNERDNIALVIWLIIRYLLNVHEFEIVVVDDNSPDGTQDVVKQLQRVYSSDRVKLVCRPKKLGLGSAYLEGLSVAAGDYVILMDADLSHHPKHLPEFIARQQKTGCDIVTGTRYAAGGGVAGWNLIRKFTSRGANILASTILGANTSDLTGAYRLYKRDCLLKLLQQTHSKGYAFQMEVIVRAQYKGYHVAELPIVFVDRLFGESKLGVGEYVLFIKGLLGLLLSL